jgi:hypothetical protein
LQLKIIEEEDDDSMDKKEATKNKGNYQPSS